jgi:hypothetical protein
MQENNKTPKEFRAEVSSELKSSECLEEFYATLLRLNMENVPCGIRPAWVQKEAAKLEKVLAKKAVEQKAYKTEKQIQTEMKEIVFAIQKALLSKALDEMPLDSYLQLFRDHFISALKDQRVLNVEELDKTTILRYLGKSYATYPLLLPHILAVMLTKNCRDRLQRRETSITVIETAFIKPESVEKEVQIPKHIAVESEISRKLSELLQQHRQLLQAPSKKGSEYTENEAKDLFYLYQEYLTIVKEACQIFGMKTKSFLNNSNIRVRISKAEFGLNGQAMENRILNRAVLKLRDLAKDNDGKLTFRGMKAIVNELGSTPTSKHYNISWQVRVDPNRLEANIYSINTAKNTTTIRLTHKTDLRRTRYRLTSIHQILQQLEASSHQILEESAASETAKKNEKYNES